MFCQDFVKIYNETLIKYVQNVGDRIQKANALKIPRELRWSINYVRVARYKQEISVGEKVARRTMDRIFQKIIQNNFSDLKGATVDASIPIPKTLINEIIETSLKGNKNIASIRVSVHTQNRVSADIKTTLLPWPLHLKLKLDKSVDFASYSSPKIRAWMENNRLLGSLGSLFKALPEGIKLYGDQLVIDLGAFLHTPEQKQLLSLVKSVGIRTEAGKVILDAKIEVNE